MTVVDKVWVFKALYVCEACVADFKARTSRPAHVDENDEHSYDSDVWPKGPFYTSEMRVDAPVHCDSCGALAICGLTDDGVFYVADCLREACASSIPTEVLDGWANVYGGLLETGGETDVLNLYAAVKRIADLEREVAQLRDKLVKASNTPQVAKRALKSRMGTRVDVKGRPARSSKRKGSR